MIWPAMRGTRHTDSLEGFEKTTKIILENIPKNAFFKKRNPAGKRGGKQSEFPGKQSTLRWGPILGPDPVPELHAELPDRRHAKLAPPEVRGRSYVDV